MDMQAESEARERLEQILQRGEKRENECSYCNCAEVKNGAYSFGKDFPDGDGNIALCIRHSAAGYVLHAEVISYDDSGEECSEGSGNAPISICPMCGRKLAD